MYGRIALFKNAVRKEKNPRVPYLSNLFSWKIWDAGLRLSEALFDYDQLETALRHTFSTYPIDVCHEVGDRNPLRVSSVLGAAEYIINDGANAINVKDQCFMEYEEYSQLIADPRKFIWEVIIPRKCHALEKNGDPTVFRRFVQEYNLNNEKLGERLEMLKEEFGVPELADYSCPLGVFSSGYEILFNFFRGIKGVSKDMRRDPDRFLEAIQALDAVFVLPALEASRGKIAPGTSPEHCFDAYTLMLGHTILSPKQFERYYWPHLQRVKDYLTDNDKLGYFFIEGDSQRFYDFFNELPEKRCALHVEQNDIFAMKKQVHCTLAGGMPVTLLGSGTREACVDYAKRLIDELAGDYGYIFSENKMVSFVNDCRRENYLAVTEYVTGRAL